MMLVNGFKHSNEDDLYLGQEVLCPDGLGRITKIGHRSITVETYVNNRGCNWDSINILVKE